MVVCRGWRQDCNLPCAAWPINRPKFQRLMEPQYYQVLVHSITGIGTRTLSWVVWDSLSCVLRGYLMISVVCHYMMHPRGKIQSPSCPPVAAADPHQRNCAVSSRPGVTVRCIKQTPFLWASDIPPPTSARPPEHQPILSTVGFPLLALTSNTPVFRFDHKFTVCRGSLSFPCSQPVAKLPPRDLSVLRGYFLVRLAEFL